MDYQNTYYGNQTDGYELSWDSEIAKDGPDYVTVEDGDYRFTVTQMDRERHPGSAKLPPCNKAVVHIRLEIPDGVCTIRHNLFLHSKCEGLLCEFFRGIGQRQHGQRIAMNWSAVVGATGRCHVTKRSFTGKDGQLKWTNDITKFYDPEPGQQPAQPSGYVAGKF